MKQLGAVEADGLEIHNARLSHHNEDYTDFLYTRLQRNGLLYRDCQRMVNQDRNVFAACMVAAGDADAHGDRPHPHDFGNALEEVRRVIDAKPGERIFGLSIVLARGRTVLHRRHARCTSCRRPDELADIAIQTAAKARQLGHEPRVALLSFSNFGNPRASRRARAHRATPCRCSTPRKVDFEYDGEMQADVALDHDADAAALSVLPPVRPGQRADHAGAALRQHLGQAAAAARRRHGDRAGADRPRQAGADRPAGATVSDIVTAAALAALDSIR